MLYLYDASSVTMVADDGVKLRVKLPAANTQPNFFPLDQVRNQFNLYQCMTYNQHHPPIEHHPVTYCNFHMLQNPITGLIQGCYICCCNMYLQFFHMQYTFKQ